MFRVLRHRRIAIKVCFVTRVLFDQMLGADAGFTAPLERLGLERLGVVRCYAVRNAAQQVRHSSWNRLAAVDSTQRVGASQTHPYGTP